MENEEEGGIHYQAARGLRLQWYADRRVGMPDIHNDFEWSGRRRVRWWYEDSSNILIKLKKIVWHQCENCDYKAKDAPNLKRHKQQVHDIDVVYHQYDSCDFKTKQPGNLKRHKQFIHNIGIVRWFHCDSYEYKAKLADSLTKHKRYVRGILVIWRHCDSCEFKSKQASHLKKHKNENKNNKTNENNNNNKSKSSLSPVTPAKNCTSCPPISRLLPSPKVALQRQHVGQLASLLPA